MKRQHWLALVAAASMGVTAQAQGQVAGTWVGETQGRGGTQMVTLVLSVDGDMLTGTFAQGDQETEIAMGSVADGTVAFQRTVGRGFTLTYAGEVEGDTLTLTPSFEGGRGGGRGDGQRRGRGRLRTLQLTRQ